MIKAKVFDSFGSSFEKDLNDFLATVYEVVSVDVIHYRTHTDIDVCMYVVMYKDNTR